MVKTLLHSGGVAAIKGVSYLEYMTRKEKNAKERYRQ